jgi:hypothetical protein
MDSILRYGHILTTPDYILTVAVRILVGIVIVASTHRYLEDGSLLN